MSAHTPGPWSVDGRNSSNPSGASVSAKDGFVRIYEAPLANETLANASLIAAAPELLNIARALLLFYSPSPWTDERAAEWERLLVPILGEESFDATAKSLCDATRAAIAKAEGRKP